MLIKYVRMLKLFIFIITTVLVFSRSGLGAELKSQRGKELPQKIDTYIRYIPCRGATIQSGKVGIVESESKYSYELKVFDKLPVKFSLTTQYIGIENTTLVKLPSHLTGFESSIETTLPFFKFNKTYLRIGISPSFYTDTWDFNSSSFRIPIRSFIIYQPSDKWTYILGVVVYPDFENEVFPIFGFIYKPNDKLTFNIIPEKPNITYRVNNKANVFAEFDSSNCEFEVSRNSSKNVVLRYREQHLGAGLQYKFNKFIQSSISAGTIFNRFLKYRDGQGKVIVKNGLYTEVRVGLYW